MLDNFVLLILNTCGYGEDGTAIDRRISSSAYIDRKTYS